jgi:TonB family protein
MRKITVIALFFLLAANSCCAQQQTNPSTQFANGDTQPTRVKVYTGGPDVTSPELLPLSLPPFSTEKCEKTIDGTVELSLLVDATGQPRNIMFLRPLGTDLDKLALQIAGLDRFRPGTHDGKPVTVGESLELKMQSCLEQIKDIAGGKNFIFRLRSQPMQKLGRLPHPLEEAVFSSGTAYRNDDKNSGAIHSFSKNGVSPPVPLNNIFAEFSDAARIAKYSGVCLISLVVDTHGMPQNAQVLRPLDYGLTEKAIEAVRRYRFTPAMKNGEPVSVMITVEVNFKFY